jgi:hypothetical protein
VVRRVEERHPGHDGRRPGRDAHHGAGRNDDPADDVDDARFALGHGIELRIGFRVERTRTRPYTRPDAGHAGDDTADYATDDTGDDAADLTADDPTHLTADDDHDRRTSERRGRVLGASGGRDADHRSVEVTATH